MAAASWPAVILFRFATSWSYWWLIFIPIFISSIAGNMGRAGPQRMTDSQTVRWGIVGPGRIASLVIKDFPYVAGAEAVAVASRSIERAQAFATEHGMHRAYGSYAEIMADADVDVLYIATPHPQHHAIALAAIAAGKAVLVEKTFTATVAGAEEVIAAARQHEVFAMEAMWTRFQPAIVAARA